MVDFTRQRQFKTRDALLQVDPGLPPGVHTFELIVQDAAGNRSMAARVKVEIFRLQIPTPPITPIAPLRPVRPIPTPITIIRRGPTG